MLAFKEIWGNKVLKKVLCVDLGSVLIDFDEKHVARLLKKNRIKRFVENDIVAHDKGLLSLWELYQKEEHPQAERGNAATALNWAKLMS